MTPPTPTTHPSLEERTAEGVLAYAVEHFHPRLVVACSFQKEASVIIDMLLRIEPRTRIFTLDTGFLFPETYETWRALEERYGVEIETVSGISLDEQERRYGPRLWEREPDQCCDVRKVKPLRKMLAENDAWVTGLRRDQSEDRATTAKLGWVPHQGAWKVCPLADWSERDVWRYLHRHGVPYNKLHDRGYSSIGCTHCTSAGAGREGRWAGLAKTECGLHAPTAGRPAVVAAPATT